MKIAKLINFFCGVFIVATFVISGCNDENTGNGGDDRPGAKTGANAPSRSTEEGKAEPAYPDTCTKDSKSHH